MFVSIPQTRGCWVRILQICKASIYAVPWSIRSELFHVGYIQGGIHYSLLACLAFQSKRNPSERLPSAMNEDILKIYPKRLFSFAESVCCPNVENNCRTRRAECLRTILSPLSAVMSHLDYCSRSYPMCNSLTVTCNVLPAIWTLYLNDSSRSQTFRVIANLTFFHRVKDGGSYPVLLYSQMSRCRG